VAVEAAGIVGAAATVATIPRADRAPNFISEASRQRLAFFITTRQLGDWRLEYPSEAK
jgi:hypothetical protein